MHNNAKILIVDDEKIALNNLEHVMKKEGYSVTATQSGQNALKLLYEQHFDVVLTDLKMEKVDGIEILTCSRELHPDTQVIMITGYGSLNFVAESIKHEVFYCVSKPFQLDEVRRVVREAIEKVIAIRRNLNLNEQIETEDRSKA